MNGNTAVLDAPDVPGQLPMPGLEAHDLPLPPFMSQRRDESGQLIRYMTPEDRERMKAHAKKFRRNGRPRTDNRDPVRSFRCPDDLWGDIQERATRHGHSIAQYLRHAVERTRAEEDRQTKYAKKRRPAKTAIAKR